MLSPAATTEMCSLRLSHSEIDFRRPTRTHPAKMHYKSLLYRIHDNHFNLCREHVLMLDTAHRLKCTDQVGRTATSWPTSLCEMLLSRDSYEYI